MKAIARPIVVYVLDPIIHRKYFCFYENNHNMVPTTASRDVQTSSRPDPVYALIVGLYGCALLAPIGIVVLAETITAVGVFTFGVLATVTLVTAVVGITAARTPGLAVAVGRNRFAWLLAVVPIALFALLIGGAEAGITPWSVDSAVGWSLLGMVAGLLLGLLLRGMSRTRYANVRLSDVTDLAQWEAWLPRRRRRVVNAILVVGCLCVPAGLVAEELFGYEWGFALGQMAMTVALAVGIGRPNGRTFCVSEAGITVENGITRRIRPWSAFTGYTLTDDALLIHTAQWWRPTIRCDTDRIERVDQVTDALGAYLSGSEQVTKQ